MRFRLLFPLLSVDIETDSSALQYDTEASASPVASDSKSPAETPLTSPEPATSPLKKRKRAASTAGDDSVDQAEKLKRRRSTRF